MPKKDMRSALASSLKAEDVAVRDRFEKAESLFSDRTPETTPYSSISPAEKEEEPPKVKRDSFTIPMADYKLINAIKQRCLDSALNVNKSEVIRAGLHALQAMTDEELLAVVKNLEKVKTGRPASKA